MSSPSKIEILAYDVTPLGPLCLRRRELLSQPGVFVTEVTLNHEFLMSSYNTDSERVIAGRSVEIHRENDPGDRDSPERSLDALVGGLGLGFTAFELAGNCAVAEVEVVEYLPQVIDWLRDGLVPLSSELDQSTPAGKKLRLTQGDVYQRLWETPDRQHDLIVIDVDHSPSDQLRSEDHGFYSVEGLRRAKRHLRQGGVLSVWSYAESSAFSEALKTVFDNVTVEPVTTRNDLVGHEQTDWLFFGF